MSQNNLNEDKVREANNKGSMEYKLPNIQVKKLLKLFTGITIGFIISGILWNLYPWGKLLFQGYTGILILFLIVLFTISKRLAHHDRNHMENYNPEIGIQNPKSIIRIGLDNEQSDAGITMVSILEKLVKDPKVTNIKALMIGPWEKPWEVSAQSTIDYLVEYSHRFSHLIGMYIGNMSSEDCEISWIVQGNYNNLWKAYPNLEILRIKGGDSLTLGKVKHPSLTTLIIETGGLRKNVLHELANGNLPKLSHLEILLGTKDYGWNGTIEDITPLLSRKKFPLLKNIALKNSEIQGDICKEILKSDLLPQLEHINLSMGTMGDNEAEEIFKVKDKLTNVSIDVSDNFLSITMEERLNQLGLNINARNQKAVEETPRDPIDSFYNKPIENFEPTKGIHDSNKAIRLEIDNYRNDESTMTMLSVLEKLSKDSKVEEIEALIIGTWENIYDTSAQPFIDFIVQNNKKFNNLKALFVGETTYASNVLQGNYQQIWQAYPNLELLYIRGSSSLCLGEIKHNSLKTLIIDTIGLGKTVLHELAKGDLPALTHLELLLGEEDYGWDGTIDDITPLLSKEIFPQLTHLKLSNNQIQGKVITAILNSSLLKQLNHLDLSMGTMNDKEAEQIFQFKDLLTGKVINLSENYLSENMVERLSQLDINISTNGQRSENEDRYVSVAE